MSRYDPSGDGAFTGPKPPVVRVVQPGKVCQYTDVNQFDFFREWINWCGGQSQERNGANVRMDEDGETIRWYGAYYLPLGGFLVEGRTYVPEDMLRGQLRPAPFWPEDLSGLFEPEPPEIPVPGPETYPGETLHPAERA